MIELVKYRNDGLAVIYLDRREKQNAYCIQFLESLKEALDQVEKEDQILAVIIASKAKAFCAGGDIHYMNEQTDLFQGPKNKLERLYKKHIQDLTLRLNKFPKLLISFVDGAAVGAGFGLALSTHLIFASSKAQFSLPFHHLELLAGDGSYWLLLKKIGDSKAMMFLLTGQKISTKENTQIFQQLIDGSFDQLEEVIHWFKQLPGTAKTKAASLKLALKSSEHSLTEHLAQARKLQAELQTSAAHLEKIKLILKK